MYRLIWFALGFLVYWLLEIAAIAVISRYFPGTIWRLQRIGDALYQAFRQKAPDTEEDDTDYNEEEEEEEEGEECAYYTQAPEYPLETAVAFNDPDPDSYGVLEGKVVNYPYKGVYGIGIEGQGQGRVYYVTADIAPIAGHVIPEGKPVTFIPAVMEPATMDGITYRAGVSQKELWYTVEYGADGDVKQERVAARNVKEKE